MRIIFDATFGEGWVQTLTNFFYLHRDPKPLLQHVHHFSGRGEKDNEWIPKIIGQDCIIVSGDLGRGNPRLPAICKEHKKTHILLSPTLQNSEKFHQARAFVVLWPDIVRTLERPPGSRFQIRTTDASHEHFTLIEKD